jgi:hypothetical protein
MSQFLNPYHFIPLVNDCSPGAVALAQGEKNNRALKDAPPHLTLDRYLDKTSYGKDHPEMDVFSGKISCEIEPMGLFAIGGEHIQPRDTILAKIIKLYKENNQWAIPASSMRGVISSLVEAASNSAMRVLADKPLSLSQGISVPKKQFGTTYDYFRYNFPHAIPLTAGEPRNFLTIAELMFGFIEKVPDSLEKKSKPEKALSLASRIFFTTAKQVNAPTECSEAMLQIMAAPKLPSPSMYFHRSDMTPYDRFSLHPQDHLPQGRKMYLHRKNWEKADSITADDKKNTNQKSRVSPLKGGEFAFEVRFTNLSRLELALLCFALRPSDSFHHQIGMGKPLGLGKMKILPLAIHFLAHDRYRCWDQPPAPPQRHTVASLAAEYREMVEKDFPALSPILDCIDLLGDPSKIDLPVHYPQVLMRNDKELERGTAAFEDKLFKWFMDNNARQNLVPLTASNPPAFSPLSRKPPDAHAVVRPIIPAAPNPDDMSGGAYEFEVADINRNTGKIKFRYTWQGEELSGALQNPADLTTLRQRGIKVGDIVLLQVLRYNKPSFQLKLTNP